MAKLTNIRERVQQPFRDSLIRTAGLTQGTVTDNNDLFQANNNPKGEGETNLRTGNVLPSDQSMIILALRVFLHFRNPILRGDRGPGAAGSPVSNGDIGDFPNTLTTDPGAGNAQGDTKDVFRLYWQSAEQLLWTFGAGDKPSIKSMPSVYFPYGGGLVTDLACSSDLISVSNGAQTQGSILKLARAVLLVPRQNIQAKATIAKLPDNGMSGVFGTTQGSRNMLSLVDNLNAIDAVQKCISLTFDGLLSRDVQLDTRSRATSSRCRQRGAGPDRESESGLGASSFLSFP
jgi:hypothetical protein